MAIHHKITNTVESFKGLEKRRSDLIDKPGYFNELKNVSFRASGSLNKRKGFHTIASDKPINEGGLYENNLGIASYTPYDQLLIMDKNLRKLHEHSLNIANNSNDTAVYVSFLPNKDNRFEYTFKSRDTKIVVDIGDGEESASNPGNIITKKQYFPIDIIPVDVPEQTKIFTQQSTNNTTLAGGTSYWYEADTNIFSSLDFTKGISFFCSSNSGYLDWVDRCKFFRIDFDDGSYIYSDCDAEYRTLVYKKGNAPEKYWKSNSLECGTNQTNSGVADSALKYYFKYAVSIGPSGYFYHMQHSNSFSSVAKAEGTITPFEGADWGELDFSGKTITRVRLAHDFSTQDFSLSNDVIAFANKEVFPQDMELTLYNSDLSPNLTGTSAIADALGTDYDTFFLFGNGDSDELSASSFSFKSHGDNAKVSLTVKGSRLTGNTTVFTYPDNIAANGYNTPYTWSYSTVDSLSTSNYYNASGSVDRNITEGENNETVTVSTITSPVTIYDLMLIIDNLDGIDLTASTSMSPYGLTQYIPACYVIPVDRAVISRSDSSSLRFFTKNDVLKGDNSYDYFGNLHTLFTESSEEFTNVSHTILNNNMYFATGVDEICKYDGNKLYRAGLPKPGSTQTGNTYTEIINGDEVTKATPLASSFLSNHTTDPEDPTIYTEYSVWNETTQTYDVTSVSKIAGLEGNATAQEYYGYMMTYRHVDNNNHIVMSTQSLASKATHVHGGGLTKHFVEITMPTIQAGTGFDINNTQLLLWRSPNTTTDAVAAASSFYQVTTQDSSGNPIERYLIDKTELPTNWQDYANVQEDPNDSTRCFISNGYVENDPTVMEVKYLDFLSDEDINNNNFILMGDYAEGRHDLPPLCKHITTHQGCLVLANSLENNTEVYYSLPEFNFATGEIGSEYFPLNSNSVILEGFTGGPITGIKTLKETLFVFHEKSVSVLSGDLTTTGVQYLKKDALTNQAEIGTIAKDSFLEYEGSLTFLSDEAVMSTNTQGTYPQELSKNIKPLLISERYDRKRAISFFTADQDMMMFFIPVRSTDPYGIFNNVIENKLFVFDTRLNAWVEWTNIDISGGICNHKGESFFISRVNGRMDFNILKKASDKSSYSDFNMPIESTLITSWDSVGNSSIFKKYIRLKVFTSDSNQSFEGTDFTLNLYLRSNFDRKDLGPIELYPGAFGGWGIAEWGKFAWGSRDFKGLRTKLFGKSKSISLNFQNKNINENFIISGYSMEVAAPYQQEIKE